MAALKKTAIVIATLVACASTAVYGYFVANSLKDFELLLMCSQGRDKLIPKSLCQAYLFNFRGNPNEIADLNRGIGIVWALSATNSDDKNSLFKFLLKKGVDINSLDERSGVSALHAMVLENDLQAVALLLKNGANPSIQEVNHGKTPLQFALDRIGKPNEPDRSAIISFLENAMSR